MAQFNITLGAILAVSFSASASAQVSTFQSGTYVDTEIVRAQAIRPGDVSAEEYEALLSEADRFRASQNTNISSYPTASGVTATTDSHGYRIEIFEAPSSSDNVVTSSSPTQYPMAKTYPLGTDFSSPEFVSQRASTTYAAPSTYGNTTTYSAPSYSEDSISVSTPALRYESPASTSHYVVKGDTLYNISKRLGVSVSALKSANGLSNNTISLGQVLTVPGAQRIVTIDSDLYAAPVTTAGQMTITQPYTSSQRPTLIRNTEPLPDSDNYAVLPKDTLYSIARRACVSVFDIRAVNGNLDPQTLQPGQRLTLPGGHCMR